ncbi:uncharacterized protein LOC142341692 isoform X1 [Convolutriloba macropyga]|uniref:uncharacterized protein LOC142341692 isoform X1 n=1 Tax=Convolutriloba macropyga TaxID=536237 RepID=UPI003F51CC77
MKSVGNGNGGGGGVSVDLDKSNIDEGNEEEVSISENLELQAKLRSYALQNRVNWKRFAITVCPAFLSRNKILEHKLKHYGKRVVLKALDLCPSFTNYAAALSVADPNSSPCLLSPGTDSIDLNENEFQEFEQQKKLFDIFDMEQLVMLLRNPFASVNVPVDYGLCVGFVCPESCADDKICMFKCDEAFRNIRKSLGNWRCKAFTEYTGTSCKLVQRKQVLNPIPFMYETWWFPSLVDQFKLEREVSLCTITHAEVENPEKPWLDGTDVILVSPLDRPKLERRSSGASTSLKTAPTVMEDKQD